MCAQGGKGDGSGIEINTRQRGSCVRFLLAMHRASEWGINAQNREYHRKSEMYVSSGVKDLGFWSSTFYSVTQFSMTDCVRVYARKHTLILLLEKTLPL